MADKSSKSTQPRRRKPAAAPRRSASRAPQPYQSSKPLFGLGTVIALIVFVALVVTAVFINRKNEADAANATPEGGETAYVFTEADGTPTSIKIEPADGEAVQLDRNAQNLWVLSLPAKTDANQSMAEAAATQVTAISIVTDEITGAAADFGLDQPAFVITVTFSGGQTHKLEVGDAAVTNNGYYVRLNKSKIMLVSLSGIDSLTQLAVAPPYLNTPTPTALPPSETPSASLPEVTVTPTP